jgi:hypothetical protein
MDIKNLKPQKNSRFKQGYFSCRNPEKYLGDVNKIIYRSSWEFKFCSSVDINPSVVKWGSEPTPIPYVSPIDNKIHKYFVDFFVVIEKDGVRESWLLEVKPASQIKKPVLEGNHTVKKLQSYNWALKTFIVNRAKFEYATKYAEERGMKFAICTETFFF